MNIIEKLTNIIAKARALNAKSLEAIKFTIFGLIIVNIFGLWYLLGWKRLSAALLIFFIIALVIILLLERNLPLPPSKKNKKEEKPKMDEETETKEEQPDEYLDLTSKEPKKQEQPKQKEESKGMFGNMDLGIPNAEDFQKRAEKALGTF